MSQIGPGQLMILAIAGLTSACVGTNQVRYDAPVEEIPGFSRTVQYELDNDFFSIAPSCVTVLPIATQNMPYTKTHKMVETAIARHLGEHINLVINPFMRDNITRNMAVDLNHPADRNTYVRQTKCKYFLELTPLNQENSYLIFWSQSALGLEVRLTDRLGEINLWKARHVATRSEGGLPLSPVSAAYSAFSAGLFANDTDVPYSLADDLARRLTATLPDIRNPDQLAIYN